MKLLEIFIFYAVDRIYFKRTLKIEIIMVLLIQLSAELSKPSTFLEASLGT